MTGWLTRLPCTRAEADAARALDEPFGWLEEPPTLVACETTGGGAGGGWELRLYSEEPPDADMLAALRALAPSSGAAPAPAPLDDADWVTLSQAGLEPVDAGRFHVHTAEHAGRARPGQVSFRIDAGQAFGTGQHDTTRGCLLAIDALARRRRFANVLDVGTGSGLLAFAAARAWRRARVSASDIDPVAVRVAKANARLNGLRLGARPGAVRLLAAPGLEHRELLRGGAYDLILANILASPLVALAPGLCASLAPGGVLVLAGLIEAQARRVAAAYRARGLLPQRLPSLRPTPRAEWPVLMFRKPAGAAGPAGRVSGPGTAGRRPTAAAW